MAIVSFTVPGKAEPAGSKRAFVNKHTGRASVTDANAKAKPWQAVVRSFASDAYSGDLLSGPLRLSLVFYVPRPDGHFGTGRNAGRLKQSARLHPTIKPDVLKLARAVEDALTGIVWRDDCQIVDEYLAKRYGEPARCEVVIEAMEAL